MESDYLLEDYSIPPRLPNWFWGCYHNLKRLWSYSASILKIAAFYVHKPPTSVWLSLFSLLYLCFTSADSRDDLISLLPNTNRTFWMTFAEGSNCSLPRKPTTHSMLSGQGMRQPIFLICQFQVTSLFTAITLNDVRRMEKSKADRISIKGCCWKIWLPGCFPLLNYRKNN